VKNLWKAGRVMKSEKYGVLVDREYVNSFFSERDYQKYGDMAVKAQEILNNSSGQGSKYLGWRDLPENFDKLEFNKINEVALKIKDQCDVLIVIGIGGSYLGARSGIEFLFGQHYNSFNKPQILFAGNNLSSQYISDILNMVKDKSICINVISKSGTTLELSISFRIFREYLEKKYGIEESIKRIYVTTDKSNGVLKKFADHMGYETFAIPDDIGGRYSVLSSVGLLPIAVSGADIYKIIKGSKNARTNFIDSDIYNNPCLMYAIIRNILYDKDKFIEILVNYEPALNYISEWWKQLFGESEGKLNQGIFPCNLNYTTDLHSMGQYVQEGRRHIFETVLNIENLKTDINISKSINTDLNYRDISDGLESIDEGSINKINNAAMLGTIQAHTEGGVPNILINIPDRTEKSLGVLYYFFEKACAISGYMNGINPFDQPGVEAYKSKMLEHIVT